MLKVMLFLGAVYTAFLISSTFGTQQRITLYNATNCSTSGRNTNVSYTTTTSIRAPWDNATSFKFTGLWRLTAIGRTTVVITPPNARSNGQCINKADALRPENPASYRFIQAERVGPADMTTNQLNLYSLQNFGGTLQGFTGNVSSLSMQAQSFAHFGKAAWLVYPNPNFTGTPVICLQHSTNGNGDTYTYNLATSVRAMSIKIVPSGSCL